MSSRVRLCLPDHKWKKIIATYDEGLLEKKWKSYESFIKSKDSNDFCLKANQKQSFNKYYEILVQWKNNLMKRKPNLKERFMII